MSRSIAAVLTALWLCLGTPAAAHPPDPANCDVPDLITLVGLGPGGEADPLGTFLVVVRDAGGVPETDYPVILDFGGCPDIRFCADQGDPRAVVDCVGRTITMMVDQEGQATFRVLGFATNAGASPGSTGPSLDVYAGPIFLEKVRVAALDQNGLAGVNAADLSLFLADYFSGQSFARSDYDGNGALTGNDLSIWLTAFFAGGSAVGGAACP
jgi:hypothetical protein